MQFVLQAASGEPVLLDRLVTVSEESRPPQLYRFADLAVTGSTLRY